MLKHIYPESAEKNVKVCCWKTTDDALEYECNLKLNCFSIFTKFIVFSFIFSLIFNYSSFIKLYLGNKSSDSESFITPLVSMSFTLWKK